MKIFSLEIWLWHEFSGIKKKKNLKDNSEQEISFNIITFIISKYQKSSV